MAGLLERSESKRYKLEKKQHIRRIMFTGLFSVLIAVLVFSYIINQLLYRTYGGYEVIHTTPRADSNTVKYERYNGKLLKYSRDGASAMDASGAVLWNGSYDMKNPGVDICGDYVAIADIGGKELYVFNGSDSGTKIETLLPITQIEVANQGMVAVVLEDKESNEIKFFYPYDISKPEKAMVPTNVETAGYPVDISISNDGHKLVTSYINIQNGTAENNVSFYNFDGVGDEVPNNLVGGYKFGSRLIPKVEFLNNNVVCAYGEDNFTLYSVDQKPKEIYNTKFKKPIKSIFSNKKYIGFIMENYAGEKKYQVLVYNLSGKKVLDKQINFDYDQVFMSGKEIIFYAELECMIIRVSGKEKFHCTFDKNLSYFMPVNNHRNYIVIDDAKIQKIKLTGAKKK